AILELAMSEKEQSVRCEAMSAVAEIYKGTDNVEVGAMLAHTVLDESENVAVRESAYASLNRYFSRSELSTPGALLDFPECIDRSFVGRFLDTSRMPEPID